MIEIEPATRLLAAVLRQWIVEEPTARAEIAGWLGLETHQLQRRLQPPQPRYPGSDRRCLTCGAELPAAGQPGRPRQFCNERCRYRYHRGEHER